MTLTCRFLFFLCVFLFGACVLLIYCQGRVACFEGGFEESCLPQSAWSFGEGDLQCVIHWVSGSCKPPVGCGGTVEEVISL